MPSYEEASEEFDEFIENFDVGNLIESMIQETINASEPRVEEVSSIINHVSSKRFNRKRIRDIAKQVDISNCHIITKEELSLIVDTFMNLLVMCTDNESEDIQTTVNELKDKVSQLKTINESLDSQLLQLNLDVTKANERITDQKCMISTLKDNNESLKSQVEELTKEKEKLINDNSVISDRLTRKRIGEQVNNELKDISSFKEIEFLYTIEYLNQYVSNSDSIYKSKDINEIVSKALDIEIDTFASSEPIYIVSSTNGKVFSRFNVHDAYEKIDNNPLVKLNKKTIHALLVKDINLTNKIIFNIISEETKNGKGCNK